MSSPRLDQLNNARELKELIAEHYQADPDDFVGTQIKECDRLLAVDLEAARRQALELYRIRDWLDDPILSALLVRNAGRVSHLAGRHREAARFYRLAATRFEKLKARAELARVWKSLVDVLMYSGRYQDALRFGRRAARYFRDQNDPLQLAQALNNIGNVYHRRDNNRRALNYYERASEIFRNAGRRRFLARSEYNRANVLANLNRLGEALKIYRTVARIHRREGNALSYANCIYSIGYTSYLAGEYQDAIRDLLRATTLFTELGDTKSVGLANLDLAQIYLDINLLDEAAQYASEASSVFKEFGIAYEGGKADLIRGQTALRKRRLGEAQSFIKRANLVFAAEANAFYQAYCRLLSGLVARATGSRQSALRQFSDAYYYYQRIKCGRMAGLAFLQLVQTKLERDGARLTAAEKQRLHRYHDFRNSPSLAIGSLYLSALVAGAEDDQEKAVSLLTKAEHLIEKRRLSLSLEGFKLGFVSDKQQVYHLLGRLLISELGKPEEGLRIVERSKSAAFLDMELSAGELERGARLPAALAEKMKSLKQKLVGYYTRLQLQETSLATRKLAARHSLLGKMRQTENELSRLLMSVERSRHVPSATSLDWNSFLKSLRQRLTDDKQILEFFLTDSELHWIIISEGGVRARAQPVSRRRLQGLIARFYFQIDKFQYRRDYVHRHQPELTQAINSILEELCSLLIKPVADLITNSGLTIVPHDLLHTVPFAALRYEGKYLIQTLDFSLIPSLRMLAVGGQPVDKKAPITFFGSPAGGLAYVKAERDSVRKAFPDARLYYGRRATVDSFLNELKSPHQVLHLAGHLLIRQDNPLFSSVCFADGWLNYFDLAGRKINADLVVLSSCLSGPQVVAPGDELLGLQRAFMGGGVKNVVSSLWPIDDKATSELMSRFYNYYRRDGDVRASYSAAVRDQIAEYSHPFYWSSFLLFSREL